MEIAELTILCLICRDDEILLQNRRKADWCGYTMPGGHIEPGESIVEAVIREVKEETGLTVENPRLCGIKQFPIEGGRYLVFLYKSNQFHGTLTSSEEGEMTWIKRSELQNYKTVPDLAEMIDFMENENLSEFQYVPGTDKWIAKIR